MALMSFRRVAHFDLLTAPYKWQLVDQVGAGRSVLYAADDGARFPLAINFDGPPAEAKLEDAGSQVGGSKSQLSSATTNVLDDDGLPLHPGMQVRLPAGVSRFWVRPLTGTYAMWDPSQSSVSTFVNRQDVNGTNFNDTSQGEVPTPTNGSCVFVIGDFDTSTPQLFNPRSLLLPGLVVAGGTNPGLQSSVVITAGAIQNGGTAVYITRPPTIVGMRGCSPFSRAMLYVIWRYTGANDLTFTQPPTLGFAGPYILKSGTTAVALDSAFGCRVTNASCGMSINFGTPDRSIPELSGPGRGNVGALANFGGMTASLNAYWILDQGAPNWGLESYHLNAPAVSLGANQNLNMWFPGPIAPSSGRVMARFDTASITGTACQIIQIGQGSGLGAILLASETGAPVNTTSNLAASAAQLTYLRQFGAQADGFEISAGPASAMVLQQATLRYTRN